MSSKNNPHRPRRPIDPPSLPNWGGDPLSAPELPEEDETPTLTSLNADVPFAPDETQWEEMPVPRPAPEDPRALAKRLAAEAKARTPAPTPRAEDPRALAKRLAAEAKAKAKAAEDPRALAKRLAAEAKAKAAEDPRALAKRLAAEAKASAAPMAPQPLPAPPPAPRQAYTPPAPAGKPKSAKELLMAAFEEEEAQAAAPKPAPKPRPAPTPAPAPVAAKPKRRAPKPKLPPAALFLKLLPGTAVETPVALEKPEVFKALWRSHRTRAQHDGDWAFVAAASVLIEAIERVPLGQLMAARVGIKGVPHAAFVDVGSGVLLAVVAPAEIYLAGLGMDPS